MCPFDPELQNKETTEMLDQCGKKGFSKDLDDNTQAMWEKGEMFEAWWPLMEYLASVSCQSRCVGQKTSEK